jgi:hypothetical protein
MRCSTWCWPPEFLEKVRRSAILFRQRLAEIRDRHPGAAARIKSKCLVSQSR